MRKCRVKPLGQTASGLALAALDDGEGRVAGLADTRATCRQKARRRPRDRLGPDEPRALQRERMQRHMAEPPRILKRQDGRQDLDLVAGARSDWHAQHLQLEAIAVD